MRTILLVDDEEIILKYLKKFLITKGYSVLDTGSGQQAVELAVRENPEIILLDYQLEGDFDGLKTLERIREHNTQVKVFMLTGSVENDLEKKTEMLGAQGFIRKPVDIHKLFQIIEGVDAC